MRQATVNGHSGKAFVGLAGGPPPGAPVRRRESVAGRHQRLHQNYVAVASKADSSTTETEMRIVILVGISLGVLLVALGLVAWPAISAAVMLGIASGVVLSSFAFAVRWRRTALWAAAAAMISGVNLALLIFHVESGLTYIAGLLLSFALFLVLVISYLGERRSRLLLHA